MAPSIFNTSTKNEGKKLTLCPSHITPGDRAPSTNWRGNCVDHRDGMDGLENRRLSCPNHCWPV